MVQEDVKTEGLRAEGRRTKEEAAKDRGTPTVQTEIMQNSIE